MLNASGQSGMPERDFLTRFGIQKQGIAQGKVTFIRNVAEGNYLYIM